MRNDGIWATIRKTRLESIEKSSLLASKKTKKHLTINRKYYKIIEAVAIGQIYI